MSQVEIKWQINEFRSGLFDLFKKFDVTTEEIIFAYQLGYHRALCMAFPKDNPDVVWNMLNMAREKLFEDHGIEI